jgi:hypothetical protein
VQDFFTKELKDDPNYVKWDPVIVEADGLGNEVYIHLDYRICNDQDWDRFYDPSQKFEQRFNHMKDGRYMNCLTGKDLDGNKVGLEISGADEN